METTETLSGKTVGLFFKSENDQVVKLITDTLKNKMAIVVNCLNEKELAIFAIETKPSSMPDIIITDVDIAECDSATFINDFGKNIILVRFQSNGPALLSEDKDEKISCLLADLFHDIYQKGKKEKVEVC